MFGLLHALFTVGVLTVDKISGVWTEVKNKEEAVRKDCKTYIDAKGKDRLVKNNRRVCYTQLDNGDYVIKDIENGKVYYNKSEEIRKEDKKQAIKDGRTIIKTFGNYTEYRNKNELWVRAFIKWRGYIDIKTEHPIREVRINGINFYMDLVSGELLRKSDEENEKYKIGSLSSDEIIYYFNDRQKDLRCCDEFGKNMSWTSDKYFMSVCEGIMDNAGVLKLCPSEAIGYYAKEMSL